MQANTVIIPLSELHLCEGNIRKSHNPAGIKELAANIKALGLLQPLVVRFDDNTAVIGGGRRLAAMRLLAEDGHIANDFGVPCAVVDQNNVEISEISLAENVMREEMHPVDQAFAFNKMLDDGVDPADIGHRFGVSETVVKKRAKLAHVSPKVLDALRDGTISLAQAQAFTISDDHKKQNVALNEIDRGWNDEPDDIRASLKPDESTLGDDDRAQFVGVQTYLDAGGTHTIDLFTEGEAGIILHDIPLLEKLVEQRLESVANEVRAEGWSKVEVRATFGHLEQEKFGYSRPKEGELPVDIAKTVEDWEDRRETIAARIEELEDIDHDEKSASEIASLKVEQSELEIEDEDLEAKIEETKSKHLLWTDRQKQNGIAVVRLHGRHVKVHRGLLPKSDKKAAENEKLKKKTEKAIESGDTKALSDIVEFPASLTELLTAHKTAAIAAKLVQEPRVALAAAVLEVIEIVLGVSYFGPVEIEFTACQYPAVFDEPETSIGYDALMLQRKKWKERIFEEASRGDTNHVLPDDLWQYLLALPLEELLDLHALCVALSVNVIQRRHQSKRSSGDRLGQTLGLVMSDWFKTKTENFFKYLNKLTILAMLAEALGKPPLKEWGKMKAKDLASLAEREVTFSNPAWVPAPVRLQDEQPSTEAQNDETGDEEDTDHTDQEQSPSGKVEDEEVEQPSDEENEEDE